MYEVSIQVQQKNGLHVRSAASLIAMLQNAVDDELTLKNIIVEYKGQRVGVTTVKAALSRTVPIKSDEYRGFV